MKFLKKGVAVLIAAGITASCGIAANANDVVAGEPVVSVSFPAEIPFTIDPFNLAGSGTLYSDVFTIRNKSEVDVIINIDSIRYEFANNTDFESLDDPYSEDQLSEKAVYMYLYSGDGSADVVITDTGQYNVKEYYLSASSYDIDGNWLGYNEDSTVSIGISGDINPTPAVPWEDGDIRLVMEYSIIPVVSDDYKPDAYGDVAEADISEGNISEPDDVGGIVEETGDISAESMLEHGEAGNTADGYIEPSASQESEESKVSAEKSEGYSSLDT